MRCPRCNEPVEKIVKKLGEPTVYFPCEHTDLFTSLRRERPDPMKTTYTRTPVLDPYGEIVRLTNLLNSVKETLAGIDLAEVRARRETARLAGIDADDAGHGWDNAKIRAMTTSWQDVASMHDVLLRLKNRLDVK